MGYAKPGRAKAAARITEVLADPYLALYSGNYDFKYSNEQFLIRLCQVVGINIDEHQLELDKLRADYIDRRDRFKPYLFIDTGFKRTSQPVFILAVCEGQRYITLDEATQAKPLHQQLQCVQSLVRQHFKDSEGSCGIWGKIQRYLFFYDADKPLALSVDGVVQEELAEVNIARASLKLGAADVTGLLLDSDDC